MTKDRALEVHRLLLESSGALDQSIVAVQEAGNADELDDYRRRTGRLMYGIYEELLAPIYREHPDVDTAIDALSVSLHSPRFRGHVRKVIRKLLAQHFLDGHAVVTEF